MEPITAAAATAAATFIMDTGGKIANAYRRVDAESEMSLTQHLRSTIIASRAYIDGNIAQEQPIVNHILKASQTLTGALVMLALEMETMTIDGRTVKEITKLVATEALNAEINGGIPGFETREITTAEELAALREATDVIDLTDGAEIPAAEASQDVTPYDGNSEAEDARLQRERDQIQKDLNMRKGDMSSDSDLGMPFGKIIEVKLAHPDNRNGPVYTLHLIIQIRPIVINPHVSEDLVRLMSRPSMKMRWLQMRAGELSFWKDFVAGMDLLADKRRWARNDKSGEMSEFIQLLAKKNISRFKKLWSVLSRDKTRHSTNLANTVMVLSEDTVQQVKRKTGYDLHRPDNLQNYFSDTMSLMIFIVNPEYRTVRLYLNGIDGATDYNYDAFKPKGAKQDVGGFMDALTALASGRGQNLRF